MAIRAGGVRLAVSAHNLANTNTSGFHALRAVQGEQSGSRAASVYTVDTKMPTDPAFELIEQRLSHRYVQANSKVLRTQEEMKGELLDLLC